MLTPQPTPNTPPALNLLPADPAGCEDCLLVPGSLQRVRRMQALREQGWSLDEQAVLAAGGVGRQQIQRGRGVRRRLRGEHGLGRPNRSPAPGYRVCLGSSNCAPGTSGGKTRAASSSA